MSNAQVFAFPVPLKRAKRTRKKRPDPEGTIEGRARALANLLTELDSLLARGDIAAARIKIGDTLRLVRRTHPEA